MTSATTPRKDARRDQRKRQVGEVFERLADGQLLLERRPGVWRVVFNRPDNLNAFTEPMYDALTDVARLLREDRETRVVVITGTGGRAFSAGNQISDFQAMTSGQTAGQDGVAYEAHIRAVLRNLAELPQITIAAVDGICVGGGLAVANTCDLRVGTTRARFGYPIARTLGNALSASLVDRCVAVFGEPLTRQMLLASQLIQADRAYNVGALTDVVAPEDLNKTVEGLADGICAAAPLTLSTTKTQLLRRADTLEAVAGDDALLVAAYASNDFREGVDAFVSKRPPVFTGQ